MSTERDVTRLLRSWLDDGATVLPDAVLDAVLEQIPTIRQRRPPWLSQRFNFMHTSNFRVAVGLAAVAAMILLGVTYFVGPRVGAPTVAATPSPAASPSPAATPSATVMPSAAPTELAFPLSGPIDPGRYVTNPEFPVNVTLDLEDGWTMWTLGSRADATAIYRNSADPPAGYGIVVAVVANVYADPCDPSAGLLKPPLKADPAALAEALAGQPGTEAEPPQPIEIDGRAGTYVEYTRSGADGVCDRADIYRWPTTDGSPRVALMSEHDQLWIVDVDGTRLVFDAFSFDETPGTALAEMRHIIESATIEAPVEAPAS